MQDGDKVYDIDGYVLTFVCETKVGFVCKPIINIDDYHTCEGVPKIYNKVFDTPPTQKRLEVIADYEQRITTLRSEFNELNCEIASSNKYRKQTLAKLSAQNKVLALIEKFFDDKITHYVIARYATYEIVPVDEAFCDSENDRYPHRPPSMKLLTLFGGSNGNYQWNLNAYRDGSGCNYECIPCESLEQARGVIQEALDDAMFAWRNGDKTSTCGGQLFHWQNVARKHGLSFPEDVAKAVADASKAKAEALVQKKMVELEAAQKALDDVGDAVLEDEEYDES